MKLSFANAPDMGYIVRGRRIYEPKDPFASNLSLTHEWNEK